MARRRMFLINNYTHHSKYIVLAESEKKAEEMFLEEVIEFIEADENPEIEITEIPGFSVELSVGIS